MNTMLLRGSALLAALVAPVSAQAAVLLTTGTTTTISAGNDFQDELGALGLTRYTSTGAQLFLDTASLITFEFLGSESALNDRFSALGLTPIAGAEDSPFTDNFAAPVALGSALFAAGDLAGRLSFFSSDASLGTATVGQDRFGIFLGPEQTSGPVTTFYLGFDDIITGDDDYDDFILRATVSAAPVVPEPATWLMMILGFGLVGAALRSARPKPAARVRFA